MNEKPIQKAHIIMDKYVIWEYCRTAMICGEFLK